MLPGHYSNLQAVVKTDIDSIRKKVGPLANKKEREVIRRENLDTPQ